MSCDPCTTLLNVPGPPGPAAAPGSNGTNGIDAVSFISAAGVLIPAYGATVTVPLTAPNGSRWMSFGEVVRVGTLTNGYGYYQITAIPDAASVTLLNLGSISDPTVYPDNINGNGILTFANGTIISPGGWQGPTGAVPSNAMLKTDNLSGMANYATCRTNLGLGTMAVQNANAVAITGGTVAGLAAPLPIASGGTGAATAGAALTALSAAATGVATGSGLTVSTTDKVLGRASAGPGAIEEISCTAAGRALLADATTASQRATLDKVLPRHGLIGKATGVHLDSAGNDNAISMEPTSYRIEKVTVIASGNAAAGTAGLFTAAVGGGTTLAADQALAALSGASKFLDLTLQAIVGTDVRTEATLYFRTGTAGGAGITANIFIFGYRYD